MAIMSEKDTYTNNINDTDERGGTTPLEHGGPDLPDHDSAALLEHGGAASSAYGDTASPERGSAEPPESNDAPASVDNAQPGSSAGEPVTSDAFTESANKPAVGADPDYRDNATEPGASNSSNHVASTDEEATSRADHAEEAPFDERSAAHAAKPAPVEHHTSRAAEMAPAYLQKAGDFLGLHKKATVIAAAFALCAVVGLSLIHI